MENLSEGNPLHFIERHLITASVIEPGSSGGFMAGHLLRNLQLAAVLEIGGDAGCPEAVRADDLLAAIDTTSLLGLRDRVLNALMGYTFARVGAFRSVGAGCGFTRRAAR